MSVLSKTRILVVDDYELIRETLIAKLQLYPDFEVVGQAEDGQTAVAFCSRHNVDVVLMDMLMPRMDGTLATSLIRAQFPNIQVIMFSCFSDQIIVRDALKAGASSYLVKNGSISQLAETIRQVCIAA